MKKLILLSSILVASAVAEVHPGKEIFDENCTTACHWHQDDGLFIRADKKAKSLSSLQKMVSFCVSQTGAEVFPEDEEQMTGFLNEVYYRFPPKQEGTPQIRNAQP